MSSCIGRCRLYQPGYKGNRVDDRDLDSYVLKKWCFVCGELKIISVSQDDAKFIDSGAKCSHQRLIEQGKERKRHTTEMLSLCLYPC